ncbi:hypothetical protein ACHAXT_008014 [Thalassiosira profunda]
MAPHDVSRASVREQRLMDGQCPNCGTRLYEVARTPGVNLKMFRKKGPAPPPAAAKRTPLTIPGVVERGQCVRCTDGRADIIAGDAGHDDVAVGVEVPSVKAVPVVAKPTIAAIPPRPGGDGEGERRKKPPPELQSQREGRPQDGRGGSSAGEESPGNLKRPPEDLIASANNKMDSARVDASSSGEGSSSDDGSSSSSGETDSDSEYTDGSISRLDSDHASTSVFNSLRIHDGLSKEGVDLLDDRKPAAKPAPSASFQELTAHERNREQSDLDMMLLESMGGGKPKALECPAGMSPEVFYQLPPEMQREVVEQGGGSIGANAAGVGAAELAGVGAMGAGKAEEGSSSADIDPETLASLPDSIRREVLEQARREQSRTSSMSDNSLTSPDASPRRADLSNNRNGMKGLTQSTTDFLTSCDMDANDFESLPEDVRNDIMAQRKQATLDQRALDARKSPQQIDDERVLNRSGFDPETLASLPEDLRQEVLDEERRQRERRREQEGQASRRSSASMVGAHRVKVPAGYDPETFEALPDELQQELLADAARRRNSAEGFDDGIVVQARPMASATSCTYTGEYNVRGKRHGDGELKWTNGDVYKGKFTDGYIQGRGTISFHDGTEYAGQWKRNRFHGEGTRRFNNGNVYTGNYVTGKRQGQGRCYFANGDMYVGDWKDDTIHGFGRYYYNNGHSFEGMFRHGKRNGRGKYQLTDGRVEIYRYVNDARSGDGVRWSANRKKAWRMNDGKVVKRVSIEEAAAIANRCGPVVEES